jgi:hypothetical protein
MMVNLGEEFPELNGIIPYQDNSPKRGGLVE